MELLKLDNAKKNCILVIFLKYGYELNIPSTYEVLKGLRSNIM